MQLYLEKETESCGRWKQTKEAGWRALPVLTLTGGCESQVCPNNGVFHLGHVLANTFFEKMGFNLLAFALLHCIPIGVVYSLSCTWAVCPVNLWLLKLRNRSCWSHLCSVLKRFGRHVAITELIRRGADSARGRDQATRLLWNCHPDVDW